MNDNFVPDMPDGLETTLTAEDYASLRELSKMPDFTHCIRSGTHRARGHASSPENTRRPKSGVKEAG